VTSNTLGPRARAASAIGPLIIVTTTSILLAVRMASAGNDPSAWFRAGIGALSLVVLLVASRGNVVRAAVAAFAIECVGSIGLFVFVDAPAVQAHYSTIVRAVAAVAPHGIQ
jgi:hypothetical protein